MILEKEQIQRYLRHILIPEISGPGQKKLLDSSILICCHNVSNSAFMLYYLAAMGVGRIYCYSENSTGVEFIQEHIKELNPDVVFSIANDINGNYDAIVISCERNELPMDTSNRNVPIILTAASGDCGFLKSLDVNKSTNKAIDEISRFYEKTECSADTLFSKACLSLLGVLASIEVVKALLKIGILCRDTLQFDLYTYNFQYGKELADNCKNRLNEINIKNTLKDSKALIVGSGGLGSPAALMLSILGIGTIGLVDYDVVEISNLNRQILHSTAKIGMAKVKSAEEFLIKLNPDIEVCTYEQKFSVENGKELIEDYDIVVDGLDNLPTRYLLNDACYFSDKSLIEAGVLGFNGLTTALMPNKGPCYRCIFPESKDNSKVPSCSETGVLGAVPGVMGIIQAVEVIKILTGIGTTLQNKILQFDAISMEISIIEIDKDPACELCSNDAVIHSLKAYEFVCNKDKE